jgi:hypothetical protein
MASTVGEPSPVFLPKLHSQHALVKREERVARVDEALNDLAAATL